VRIIVVYVADVPADFIGNSSYAAFVSAHWR
jgi:hypothetical protein